MTKIVEKKINSNNRMIMNIDETDDVPELKLSGEPAILCTGRYREKKEEISRILGISLEEADKLLQENGIDRMM